MTTIDYASIIKEQGLNTYFVAEGDRNYNVRKQTVIPANPCCNCYSVAKAFTVTAIGMLCDKGLLSPQSYMADLLSDVLPDDMDERWRRVTVHDLMLHRVGFDSGRMDIDVEDASTYDEDYLKSLLTSPLPYEPGTVTQYTDAAFYILSRIVAQVSGEDLVDFLRPTLMKTMKFKELAWSTCPHGYSMGATGLYLRTEDMVKLGILYLNDGLWEGTRVLSKEWVDTVFSNGYELKGTGDGWYRKGGMHGQVLLLNPTKGIAIACHSYDKRMKAAVLLENCAFDQ